MTTAKIQRSILIAASVALAACANDTHNVASEDGKAGGACLATSVNPERYAATVNGCGIAKSSLSPAGHRNGSGPEVEAKLLEEQIGRELIRQEFISKPLPADPELRDKLDSALRVAYSQVASEYFVKSVNISDDELRQAYEQKKRETNAPMQYKVKHILLDSEKAAAAAIAKLNKGESFEKLAKKLSTDKGSQESGGDLGWISPGETVPEFSAAVEQLKNGETTAQPVKSQFGWHVIMREDSKQQEFPPFESIKDRLLAFLRMEKFQKHVEQLKSQAKIDKTLGGKSQAAEAGK